MCRIIRRGVLMSDRDVLVEKVARAVAGERRWDVFRYLADERKMVQNGLSDEELYRAEEESIEVQEELEFVRRVARAAVEVVLEEAREAIVTDKALEAAVRGFDLVPPEVVDANPNADFRAAILAAFDSGLSDLTGDKEE